MTFDQYQRYALAAKIIESVRGGNGVLSILEVGQGSQCTLREFLATDEIKGVDINPERVAASATQAELGDATRLSQADGSYDVVMALDVFEHVDPARREHFLFELQRVARRLVLICAPFAHPAVQQAEREADGFWQQLFHYPHPYLVEHADNGLPDLANAVAVLSTAPGQLHVIRHGDLGVWTDFLKAQFASECFPSLLPFVERLREDYRDFLFDEDFHVESPYRHFLAWVKPGSAASGLQALAEKPAQRQSARSAKSRALAVAVSQVAQWTYALSSAKDLIAEQAASLQSKIAALETDRRRQAELISRLRNDADALEQSRTAVRSALVERIVEAARLRRLLLHRLAQRIVRLKLAFYQAIRRLWSIDHRIQAFPVSQVEESSRNGYFRSTGDDPYFMIYPSRNLPMPDGLLQIRYRGKSPSGPVSPQLYFDTGEGFSESQKVPLGESVGEPVVLFERLPRGVKRLRLDPTQTAGDFQLDDLQIVSGNKIWAMTQALRYEQGRYKPDRKVRIADLLTLFRSNVRKDLRRRLEVGNRTRSYETWVQLFDHVTERQRQQMAYECSVGGMGPLISILMPVYDPPVHYLEEAIRSVQRQIYPHWELCIADDASKNPEIAALLKRYAEQDSRIKLALRETNGHISAASNTALSLASGKFVAFLDHDDCIAETALYWVVKSIAKHADALVFYSDEDKIDGEGRRSDPYFKCDWNPYLFRSQNMLNHFGVYHAATVRRVGGFRTGYEGSQDYDLALRVTENIRDDQIIHIPRVLYHWRMIPGSTAMGSDEKPYAALAAQKAIGDHLERMKIAGEVVCVPETGHYRVRYALGTTEPLVSMIIPTRNAEALVRQCIDSIRSKTRYSNYEIILVDNGSDDPAALAYFEQLKAEPGIQVIRDDGPFNYSALNNKAARQARGEVLALINNDIEVINADWLSEMVSLAMRPEVGAVGARLWYPNNSLQHGGVVIGIGGVAGHAHLGIKPGDPGYFGRAMALQCYSAVTGACLVVRSKLFWQVNGLDEVNLAVGFNDIDFCLKLVEAGYRNIWTPFAELYHHESATRGPEDSAEKKARFKREADYMNERWPALIRHDPAYSPNLSLADHNFSLAWPPRTESFEAA